LPGTVVLQKELVKDLGVTLTSESTTNSFKPKEVRSKYLYDHHYLVSLHLEKQPTSMDDSRSLMKIASSNGIVENIRLRRPNSLRRRIRRPILAIDPSLQESDKSGGSLRREA
jgi:hypothetical protein